MNAETMERLLIDKRLGELPPDTERLLEAYVQVTPGAETVMAEIDGVMYLASRVLRPIPQAAPELLPPLSLTAAFQRERSHHSQGRRNWARPLAMAASVVLAFLLGTHLTSTPPVTSLDRTNGIARTSHVTPSDGAEFWSVEKFVSDRVAIRTANGAHIEWTSPLVWPQLGEKL